RKGGCFKEGPFDDRKKIMRTLCKAAGVKYFRFHALRHSGASLMASDGRIPIRSIQKILGHENISTTEIYLHSLSEAERAAMEVFEEKSGGIMREEKKEKDDQK
ncbi:MAG: tyrosine-type recombinase/integrase, partial [Spirochaetota bacterium]